MSLLRRNYSCPFARFVSIRGLGQNAFLSKSHFSSTCAYLHAIACNSVHSKFFPKNMCEVSPSAQLSARTEKMNSKLKIANPQRGSRATACRIRVNSWPFVSAGPKTKTTPFLHHFSGVQNMNSRIHSHLQGSRFLDGAILTGGASSASPCALGARPSSLDCRCPYPHLYRIFTDSAKAAPPFLLPNDRDSNEGLARSPFPRVQLFHETATVQPPSTLVVRLSTWRATSACLSSSLAHLYRFCRHSAL
jgi:hypothetical protein